MAYTREQVNKLFSSRIQEILNKERRDKEEESKKEAEDMRDQQEFWGRLNAVATVGNVGKQIRETILLEQLKKQYGEDTDEFGNVLKRYQFKNEDAPWYEDIFAPLEETPGYKQFKGELPPVSKEQKLKTEKAREEMDIALAEEPLPPPTQVPEAPEYSPEELEEFQRQADLYAPTVPAPLDMAAIDESTKKELWNKWNQDQAKSAKRFGMPELTYDEWLEGVESGEISAIYTEQIEAPEVDIPDVGFDDVSVETPAGLAATPTGLEDVSVETAAELQPLEYPTEELEKIQAGAERAQADADLAKIGKTKRIEDMVDPLSDEFDPSRRTPGLPEGVGRVPELAGAEGAPIARGSQVLDEGIGFDDVSVEVPDVGIGFDDVSVETPAGLAGIPAPGEPGWVGKAFQTGQTTMELANLGRTLTSEDATDEQKGVASVQGTKMLTDLATKKAGEQTAAEIGSKAFSDVLAKKGAKEGFKLGGKQAIGTALGGALGAYQMVTGAKEAGKAWEEKDYDEAILHGMSSGSGALQTFGAGMMATGIGAPIGAIMYGVGKAGALISNAGLFLEGLFGGKTEVKAEEPRQKFDVSSYFNSLRSRRRY